MVLLGVVGSKGEVYTSRVHYMVQKGMPYLIVPENDMHNIVMLYLFLRWLIDL